MAQPMKLKFWGGPWDGEERNIALRGPDFLIDTNCFTPAMVHVYSLVTRNGTNLLEYRGTIASAAIS